MNPGSDFESLRICNMPDKIVVRAHAELYMYIYIFHHLQKDKQHKQRHSLRLGKKRRESSKRNYYIISPRVTIKEIIIIDIYR